MNFIQIVLTTKCQLACWHCPVKVDIKNGVDVNTIEHNLFNR